MKKFKMIVVLLIVVLMFSSCTTNNTTPTDPTQQTEPTQAVEETKPTNVEEVAFTPNEDMEKLVLVIDDYSYRVSDNSVVNTFNNKLKDIEKDYYLEIKTIDNTPTSEEREPGLSSIYSSLYQDAVIELKENNEQIDLVALTFLDDSSGYYDSKRFIMEDVIMNLDEHLSSQEGLALYNAIDKRDWELSSVNNSNYFIPANTKSYSGRAWSISESDVNLNNIDVESLQNELWDVLTTEDFKDKKPYVEIGLLNKTSGLEFPISPYFGQYIYKMYTPFVGVKYDDETFTAINILEDDYIINSMKTMQETYTVENSDIAIRLGYNTNGKITHNPQGTYEVPLDNILIEVAIQRGLGVASWSNNSEKALDLLKELNTNLELATLLNFGIEGQTYSLDENGKVTFSNEQYERHENIFNIFSNKKVLSQYFDEEEIAEDAEIKEAILIGFMFDIAPVKDEIIATNEIYNIYNETLFAGQGDYETLNNEFMKELDKAGIQKIVDEVNKQLSEWIAVYGE